MRSLAPAAFAQAASGRVFDYFTTFPEKLPSERENWTKYVRVPVEAAVRLAAVVPALRWQWVRREGYRSVRVLGSGLVVRR